MSIDRVKEAHERIRQQLQPGDEIARDLPDEVDGRVTFTVETVSLSRARALTIACQKALQVGACDIEPPRQVGGESAPWKLVIIVDVGGVRAL